MADPRIDRRRGAPIFARIYTHHSWHLYALEESGGHAPLDPPLVLSGEINIFIAFIYCMYWLYQFSSIVLYNPENTRLV